MMCPIAFYHNSRFRENVNRSKAFTVNPLYCPDYDIFFENSGCVIFLTILTPNSMQRVTEKTNEQSLRYLKTNRQMDQQG